VATDTFAPARTGYGGAGNGYGSSRDGYGSSRDGYGSSRDGYGSTRDGYGRATDEYAGDTNGYDRNGYRSITDGFAGAPDEFAGSAAHLGPGSYTELTPSGPMLVAPDAGVYPDSWQADQDRRREAARRGLIVGAVTGFLATAVAIGVSTLAAAFVRPQASPMIAMGGVFIDRAPSALKNFAVHHFGAHDKTALLLLMYVTIAFLAMASGALSRRAIALGVAGIAASSLFGAFVAITRPGSHVSDVAPSVIGGMAGVAAFLWLVRASAPVAPVRRAHGGGRRRTR
jgi:hypothetical protein